MISLTNKTVFIVELEGVKGAHFDVFLAFKSTDKIEAEFE